MPRAYLGIGSNLGRRSEHIRYALREIARHGTLQSRSAIVETEPVECEEGGMFLNTCVCLDTALSPRDLLAKTMAIETALGRRRRERNAPRTIDIDILLFGDWTAEDPDLVIPHPRMHERWFVLAPLATIAPNAVHPVLAAPVRTLLERLGR